MKRIFLTVIGIISFLGIIQSQTITQTIRGKVVDAVTQEALIGASVVILNSYPTIGRACDIDGYFILEKVPVGRQSIQVSMIGYETYQINEIMISTGKETILDIALQISSIELDGVVVTVSKDVPLNSMTSLSARQFSVEETQRYAGGMDDPARLVSSFAGVATPSVSANGISVRGNSPGGLLWRIEGVEVPNPNHFANMTVAGGGLLTTISNNVMGNSDFYTGAFPAEYGNAYSGVFDIKLQNGNTSDRGYIFQAGIMGIDFAAEGPLKKGKNASYIMNYRYSTLGLIAPLLPSGAGVIKYQDLTFKINFPTKKSGLVSFWGVGGIDRNTTTALDSAEWKTDFDRDNSNALPYMFASGLSHKIILDKKTFLNSAISSSGSGLKFEEERLDYNLKPHPQSNLNNSFLRFTIQSIINHRFGEKHTNRSGGYFSYLSYIVNVKQAPALGVPLMQMANGSGQSYLLQVFTQSKINPTPRLTFNLGLHYQHFMLNNQYSIEPRTGLKYKIDSKQSVALAYGLHSRLEMLPVYFADINGTYPNKDLKFMKSSHFVFSYNLKVTHNLRLSIEPYYQYLDNVPVSPDSYVSSINIENNIFFNEELVSEGTGRNVGIDLTLEHYLKNGFYYLFTTSVFDSKYTGVDDVERNTRFNKNYVFNALIGKEWVLGKRKNKILGTNFRLNYMGGNRIEPINEVVSLAIQDVVLAETPGHLAYEDKFNDMPIFSFTFSYRKNKANYSSVWSVQVLNATNTKQFVTNYYDSKTKSIKQKYDGIIVPNISYKIEF